MPTVIRSKRGLLFAQAILALIAAAMTGWMMQSWSVLQSSALGKLSVDTRLPVIAGVTWVLAIVIIGTVLLDHWNFQIEILDDHLLVHDRLGTTKIRYDNIKETRKVSYGAGIALKNPAAWLESFEGKQAGFDKLCRMSGFLKGTYGCDLCIKKVRLDLGVERFLALLDERAGKAVSQTSSV